MKELANILLGILLVYALPGFAFLAAVFLLIMAGPDTMEIVTDDPTVLRITGFLHWGFFALITLTGGVVAWRLARRVQP